MDLDVAIFGGGAAGLWLLDLLSRQGHRVLLLEARALGAGQTAASQGILHGGFKYTLNGLLTRAAVAVRRMPDLWRECLAGSAAPDLSQTRKRAEFCYLWQTDSLTSRLGMIGARFGLRIAPTVLAGSMRPPELVGCPGLVARLDEQVIDPVSLIRNLALRHADRLLRINVKSGLSFQLAGRGQVDAIRLMHPLSGEWLTLRPRSIVLTAGAGNADLRELAGLSAGVMQRRPLHMVMLRGAPARLNGHCVDGARTRVTITSDVDAAGNVVWQVGGDLAEVGVAKDETSLLLHARAELEAVMPNLDLAGVEWAAYRIDRAEARTGNGARPNNVCALREGNVITGWPTKLVLVPALAEQLAELIPMGNAFDSSARDGITDWPRPDVAPLPWNAVHRWRILPDTRPTEQARRKTA